MAEISGDLTHRLEGFEPSEAAAVESGVGESQDEGTITALEPVGGDIATTVDLSTEVTAEAEEALVPEDPLVAEAPKRRRSRRTTALVEKEAEVAVAPPVAEGAEAEPAVRPRRRRPSRARVAEVEIVEAPVETVAVPADQLDSEPAVKLNGESPVTRQAPESPAVSETAAEPTSAEAPAVSEPVPAPEPDPDRPKRSGWWQRAKASFGS